MADCIGGGEECEAESECDSNQSDSNLEAAGRQDCAAASTENKPESTDEFRREFVAQFHTDSLCV